MKDHNCCLVHERARETVAASGDVSTAIRLARLVAAWRKTEVRTHRSRSRKPARVFNGADVHQRGESTDTRHRHQQTADRIRPDLLQHRLVKDGDLLAQLPPRRKEGAHDQSNFGSAFKKCFDLPVKSETPAGARQQTERLQHPAYHVGEPRRHAHELGARSEECPSAMRIEGLHVDRPIPSRAHDLGQPFGVVLVGLVELHLQSGLHFPGVQTLDIETSAAQTVNEPGCHRTGLDAHFGVDTSMLRNASRNCSRIGGADAAPKPPALLVDNADRGRLLRYVQSNVMRQRNLRWCKPPGNMPGSRHYRLLGFEPRLPEVHIWRVSATSTNGGWEDLVMWDNRQTIHQARRFDRNEVHDVRRPTLARDAST